MNRKLFKNIWQHLLLLIGTLFCMQPSITFSATTTVDLTSASKFDVSASTGFWNTVTGVGQLQAPYVANADNTKRLIFGNGSDGAFNSTGNVTFNTDSKSIYNFTTFTLNGGHTLTVTGSNPLIIRSLNTVTINGTIAASGSDGQSNTLQDTNSYAGGSGGPAGATGGTGAIYSSSQNATSGSDASTTSPGGALGSNSPGGGAGGGSQQGGNGGCNADGTATFGTNNVTALNCTGANPALDDPAVVAAAFETTFVGGGGGGGGGLCVFSDCGVNADSANGGGGGGGAIRISAFGDIVTTGGNVTTNGGNGGADPGTSGAITLGCGNAGGGGAGGSVWLQSAGDVTGGGNINVNGGTGGTGAGNCAGFNGGNGSAGVTRADTGVGADTFTVNPAGPDVSYATAVATGGGPYYVYSTAYDFSDGVYEFSNATSTENGCGVDGTAVVEYQGSNDGSSWSAAVDETNLASLNGYAFIRFRANITTTGANPPCVTALSFDSQLSELTELELQGGLFCGASPIVWKKMRNQNQDPPKSHFFFLMFLILLSASLVKFYFQMMESPTFRSKYFW